MQQDTVKVSDGKDEAKLAHIDITLRDQFENTIQVEKSPEDAVLTVKDDYLYINVIEKFQYLFPDFQDFQNREIAVRIVGGFILL